MGIETAMLVMEEDDVTYKVRNVQSVERIEFVPRPAMPGRCGVHFVYLTFRELFTCEDKCLLDAGGRNVVRQLDGTFNLGWIMGCEACDEGRNLLCVYLLMMVVMRPVPELDLIQPSTNAQRICLYDVPTVSVRAQF